MTKTFTSDEVLLRPLINEKSTAQREKHNQYVFEVAHKATKDDIRKAVEKFFSVKVKAVRTTITHGKTRRVGNSMGRVSNWKKAIVSLADGQSIDFFAAA